MSHRMVLSQTQVAPVEVGPRVMRAAIWIFGSDKVLKIEFQKGWLASAKLKKNTRSAWIWV